MTITQCVVSIAVIVYVFMSIKGAARILSATFLPSWAEIAQAVFISFVVNGIAFGFCGVVAYCVTQWVT